MSLSVWLVLTPQWLSMLLVTAFFTGFGVGLVLLVRQFVHHSILKKHNDIAGFVFATVGVLYGVMLAFVVILVWEQYNDAKSTAEREAAQAYSLYRDLSIYPQQAEAKQALDSLGSFVRSVVDKEYPALYAMKWETPRQAIHETRAKFDKLWEDIKKIVPKTMQEQSIYTEMLKDINILGQERAKRLTMARDDLPDVVWIAVVVGGLLTIGFTALFGNEHLLAQAVITGLLAIMTSIVIFVIIDLNFPFTGDVRIKPEGYEFLIEVARWGEKTGK